MQSIFAGLHEVSKQYDQPGADAPNIILNRVSLQINRGESIAITGPSGSGKSTLLNILGTLDKPSSGRVIIDGTNVNEYDETRLAAVRNRFIGFVFQQHHLLPQLSLIENVLLPVMPVKDKFMQKLAGERAWQLLEKVGLSGLANRRPGQMSPGECQRAAVVRALVNQPRLLLADEPTGSLDAQNACQLGELIAALNHDNDLAVLVVTHSMELASLMEKNYRLTSGLLNLIERE